MFGWALEAWAVENVGELWIDVSRPDGTVDVLRADPIVSLNVEGMKRIGIDIGLIQDDGTIRLTDQISYRYLRDLTRPGVAAYERV